MTVATVALSPCGEPLATAGSTPNLFIKCATGKHIDQAKLEVQRNVGTKNNVEVITVGVTEVVVARDPSTGMATGKRQWKPVVIKMTGPDGPVCSLVYPVVALARGGAAALAALQSQGYNCSVMDAGSQDCQGVVSTQMCTDLANQLAENIDAALALDDETERGAFQAGLHALGFTTCQTATTTTTTTSSTTSTTGCAAGQTNCGGTCVNTSTDVSNCGTCGNVCQSPNTSCISGVCTIP
jgi:hypothetical protein